MESQIEVDLTKVCRHNSRTNCDFKCNKCEKIYPCKLCHDEESKQERDLDLKHELILKDIKEIKCRRCDEF
jgi:hypothetical protein